MTKALLSKKQQRLCVALGLVFTQLSACQMVSIQEGKIDQT